ncbi:MAG TPA: hypothetical protein VHN18_09290, partial [Micromonosporaceae bacterium]|nr:hypothetical protein [Micromonosporaceae bacterium]
GADGGRLTHPAVRGCAPRIGFSSGINVATSCRHSSRLGAGRAPQIPSRRRRGDRAGGAGTDGEGQLGLAPSDDDNRRVLAVLAYLDGRSD